MIGAGRIGGNIAARWAAAGHDVAVSYSRSPTRLAELAGAIGARAMPPPAAAAFGEVVLVSVPWPALDDALAQAGDLTGRVVLDTTNPYGPDGLVTLPGGATAAQATAARLPGSSYATAFNTLTSAFQRAVGDSARADGAGGGTAMFHAAADERAAAAADELVAACGFVPVRLPWSRVALLEAPRRDGSVYGEEYGVADAVRIAGAAVAEPARAAALAVELRRPG